jgi:hypothetical protein
MACQPNQPGSIVTASRETLSAGKVRKRVDLLLEFKHYYPINSYIILANYANNLPNK